MVGSFRLLDLTLRTPEENLALDEALLDQLEEAGGDPVLRFWESTRHFVVLGRGGRLSDEVDVATCQQDDVPVLRRASGGGAVLQGPGCQSYAFVFPISLDPQVADIRLTNQFILARIAKALERWHPAITVRGVSDLTIDGLKVSGNAQRRTRHAILYHGTVLYGMSPHVIARYLKHPTRQPDYRRDRPHKTFVGTIAVAPQEIKQAIADAWASHRPLDVWPQARMATCLAKVVHRMPE